jgi:hypothetical protein
LLVLSAGCTLLVGDPDPRDTLVGGVDLANGACADVQTDPRNCGFCGHDCTALPGVNPQAVRCTAGSCDLRNACNPGRADCGGGYLDGCETDLSTANHCGSCSAICGGEVPLCVQTGPGVYTCADSCPFFSPTQCGSSCVDTFNDSNHCGGCNKVCAAGNNMAPVCQGGVCSTECNFGFHTCSGKCVSDTSIDTCGSRCTPCPAPPTHATEICDPFGGCDFKCDTGFRRENGQCLQNMSMDMKLGTGDMAVDNRPLCDCSGLGSACLLGCVGQNCCLECDDSAGPPTFCLTGTVCTASNTCQPS